MNSPGVGVFVLIDALGWSLLKEHDFLSGVLVHRQPVRTVLGYSSGAIPAILTGVPPARNGCWNLLYYDPLNSPFRWLRHVSFLPLSVLDHRVTRRLLKELGRRVLGMGPLFECCVAPHLLPWFNWSEKRNLYHCNAIDEVPSIFDDLSAAGIPFRAYSYHEWKDEEICCQAKRDIESKKAQFYFLYLCEMDHVLHTFCTKKEIVFRQLDWYARLLEDVFEAALAIDSEATFVVFSDHGMTAIRRQIDLAQEISRLGFVMPSDYLVVYDSTMVRLWFFNVEARRAITACLERIPCGRVLSDREQADLGIGFSDRRYGDLVFLLEPGCVVAQSDFNGGRWNPTGMHGYHPDHPDSDAVFLSNRTPSTTVRSVMDICSVMHTAASV